MGILCCSVRVGKVSLMVKVIIYNNSNNKNFNNYVQKIIDYNDFAGLCQIMSINFCRIRKNFVVK